MDDSGTLIIRSRSSRLLMGIVWLARAFRWDGLAIKQAVVTLIGTLVFGLLLFCCELVSDWRSQCDEIRQRGMHALELVQEPAQQAVYDFNSELAERVLAGLFRDEAVEKVVLIDDQGKILSQLSRRQDDSRGSPLAAALFEDVSRFAVPLIHGAGASTQMIGGLELVFSPQIVAQGFLRRTSVGLMSSVVRVLGIGVLVVIIFYLLVIRPLVRLSDTVGRIDAGRPGTFQLAPLRWHRRDELGMLVDSLNGLLSALAASLESRDRAEGELKLLARSLEQRVEERTRELEAASRKILDLNRLLQADNRRLEAEVEVSSHIQRMTLPGETELARIAGIDIAAEMEPATEVGGDYYDVLDRVDGVRIAIGDVADHGLESGVVMLMIQSAVRTLATVGNLDAPGQIDVLNRALAANIERLGSGKTATLSLLDYRRPDGGSPGRLEICGQHETVIVVRREGRLELVDTTVLGLPLALVQDIRPYLSTASVELGVGDTVVLYTDGITETANERDELYGLDRLCRLVMQRREAPARSIRDAIFADVRAFRGAQTQYDDVTAIVFKPT